MQNSLSMLVLIRPHGVSGLRSKITTADEAEGARKEAQAAALDATKASNAALKYIYDDASAFVSLIEGLERQQPGA